MLLEDLKLPERFDWWNVRSVLEEWAFKLINSGRFLPPGTVAICAAMDVPDGWVECDGTLYENTKFPDLYTAVGTTYGSTATTFAVPTVASPFAGAVYMIKT